jgi:hypothetical protein
MVEAARPKQVVSLWGGVWIGALILTCVFGFGALHDVKAPDNLHPAMCSAKQALTILFLVVAGACVVIALWDRARQTGRESEGEISFEAFSDVEGGWVRPLLVRLAMTLLILQTLLDLVPRFLTLIAEQTWLKALVATPLMVLLVWSAMAPYPALISAWSKRKAQS